MAETKNNGLLTDLIRGGVERSHFDETAEALYLTSGYVYGTAEEAEAAFEVILTAMFIPVMAIQLSPLFKRVWRYLRG